VYSRNQESDVATVFPDRYKRRQHGRPRRGQGRAGSPGPSL